MNKIVSVAIDLGASGGKTAKGFFDGEKVIISDIYNFVNKPIEVPNALYWDVFGLYKNILKGIKTYVAKGNEIESVAVDTWGASYGLLDKRDCLLEPIYHYRDRRTQNSLKEIYKIIDKKSIYEMTGCLCNRTYTLPQLFSYREHGLKVLESASKMLFLPDLLGYFLTGEISTEMTIAGTSALMNTNQEEWCYDIFEKLSLPKNILTNIVDAGTVKGTLRRNVTESTGAGRAKLVATVGHDSASGVVAIPGFGKNKLYISIGTNISMGIENEGSIVTNAAFECGFKNTGGIDRRKIIYRDFAGFWLVNELRRVWIMEGKDYSFEDLIKMGENSRSQRVYIDVEEPEFNNADGDIRIKINNYLKKTGQKFIELDGEFVLCILESITMKIKYYADLLITKLHIPYLEVYVINGGSRNRLLMQMISNALETEIRAGMPYATLAGNILTQLYSLGKVKSVDEMRELSKKSFALESFEPDTSLCWKEEMQKFQTNKKLMEAEKG
ncbi:rhamnulokinase family protein [Vallitalea sediminicola]